MSYEKKSTRVAIEKVTAHFSAAHAIVSTQYQEGLHGHNYFVGVEIEGEKDEYDIIIDFSFLEKLLLDSLSSWDHYVLFPSKNKLIGFVENKENLEISYGNRVYSIPEREIKILNCANVTTEVIAELLGKSLYDVFKKTELWNRIVTIKVSVNETPNYSASHIIQKFLSEES
ncbi:MAG: 6-pyruvoyl trahydropterin synthase family protein [Candidatus Hodarchaeales archaeon]